MSYASAAVIRQEVARMAMPPERVSVADAANRYYRVRTSSGKEQWNPSVTPYMIEPMNMVTAREHEAVGFVGPARTGKTAALLGCAAYVIECDPSDAMIVHMTQDKAGRFSKKDLARMYRDSPQLKARLSHRASDDNVFEKHHVAGNVLYMGWPSITQLSGDTLKYMFLTDYDRMPESVGGEGTPFNLAKKRHQTFLSRGCTFFETSPGYEVVDPHWTPATPHEAPPCDGALALYNLGTRNRWYWPCPSCDEYVMEPTDISGFSFQHERDLLGTTIPDACGDVGLICPACGAVTPENHPDKPIKRGIWVPDGCRVESGKVVGERRKVPYATYWLSGAAAAFQSWRSIVINHLQAERTFDATGDEEALRNSCNLDMGGAYLPRRLKAQTDHTALMDRAEPLPRGQVPAGVRFLLALVDVQGGKDRRFVVQVIGYGAKLESWIVDRYSIRWVGDGDDRRRINPAGIEDDWDELHKQVLERVYPLQGQPEIGLRVHRLGPDSGGEGNKEDGREDGGVADKAYKFFRRMRKVRQGHRVHLLKGSSSQNAPRIAEVYPDNRNRKDRRSSARGDVPVLMVNTNRVKDIVNGDMANDVPGPGYMHWPDWLRESFYRELTVESRTNGRWINSNHARNEAFDLYTYGRALCSWLGADNMDWDSAKPWARPLDDGNSNIVSIAPEGHQAPAAAPATQAAGNARQSRFKFNGRGR